MILHSFFTLIYCRYINIAFCYFGEPYICFFFFVQCSLQNISDVIMSNNRGKLHQAAISC